MRSEYWCVREVGDGIGTFRLVTILKLMLSELSDTNFSLLINLRIFFSILPTNWYNVLLVNYRSF